jgi:hypothetical protein
VSWAEFFFESHGRHENILVGRREVRAVFSVTLWLSPLQRALHWFLSVLPSVRSIRWWQTKVDSLRIVQHRGAFTLFLYFICPNSLMRFCRRERFYGDLMSPATIKGVQGLKVKCPMFLPDYNQILSFSTDFHRSPQYQVSRKGTHWELCWYISAGRHTDGRANSMIDTFSLEENFCDRLMSRATVI